MSNSDNPQASDGRWKERYLENLEALEQLKTDHSDDVDVLKKALVRISLISDGVDSQLDQYLASLRDTVRNQPVKSIDDVIAEIDEHIRALDEKKRSSGNASIDQLANMLAGFTELDLDRATKKKIKSLSSKVSSPKTDSTELPSLIVEFSQIQMEVTKQLRHKPAESDKKAGFWRGLLSRKEAEEVSADPSQGQPVQSHEGNIEATEADVTAQVDLLRHNYDAIKDRVSGVLLAFMDQLQITDELKQREVSLRDALREGFPWPQLPETMSEGIALMLASNSGAQREFESFLLTLNSRLSDIYEVLEQSKTSHKIQVTNSKAVNDKVKSTIVKIQTDVAQSQDIGTLKNNISQQLDGIASVMDQYRDEVEVNSSEIFDVVKSLGERMESMEREATQMRSTIEQQRQQSMKDGLTGLCNRMAYDEFAAKEIARSRRHDLNLSMIVCDIDHFKNINDTYGHLSGDKVLKLVAGCIEKSLRMSDFVARYGGEEFVVLMPETNLDAAKIAAEKVRAAIEASAFHFKAQPVQITASFGVAQFQAEETLELAFQRADKALYTAKSSGRNQVCSSDPAEPTLNSQAG